MDSPRTCHDCGPTVEKLFTVEGVEVCGDCAYDRGCSALQYSEDYVYGPGNDDLFVGVFCDEIDLPNQLILDTNSTVDDRLRRYLLSCNHCRPNKGENEKDRPRHWDTKPRYKVHRG